MKRLARRRHEWQYYIPWHWHHIIQVFSVLMDKESVMWTIWTLFSCTHVSQTDCCSGTNVLLWCFQAKKIRKHFGGCDRFVAATWSDLQDGSGRLSLLRNKTYKEMWFACIDLLVIRSPSNCWFEDAEGTIMLIQSMLFQLRLCRLGFLFIERILVYWLIEDVSQVGTSQVGTSLDWEPNISRFVVSPEMKIFLRQPIVCQCCAFIYLARLFKRNNGCWYQVLTWILGSFEYSFHLRRRAALLHSPPLRQPWVWSVSDFIFLASANEGRWPILSLSLYHLHANSTAKKNSCQFITKGVYKPNNIISLEWHFCAFLKYWTLLMLVIQSSTPGC